MIEKPELKPCPFCGGKAEWNLGQHGDGTEWRYLACEECGSMGPWQKNDPEAPNLNEAQSIAAWNTRPEPPAPAGEVVSRLRQSRRETHMGFVEIDPRLLSEAADLIERLSAERDGVIEVRAVKGGA